MPKETKKHSCPFQKGTFIEKDILLSTAFLSLSKHGKTILLMLLLKRQFNRPSKNNRSRGMLVLTNNGTLELSYKELKSYGLNENQSARGFSDVIEKGFVRMMERGGKGKKSYNKYSLTDDWVFYGTEKFTKIERVKSIGYGFCSKKEKTP